MQKKYPFKFLDAYNSLDADIFFGRESEIEQLYSMIFQTDLLLVYGASGTGKTSLIQCGLASKFELHDWLPLFVRRGNDLNESLDRVLLKAGGVLKEDKTDDFSWLYDSGGTNQKTNSTIVRSTLAQRLNNIYLNHFKPLYLIFDQFEELYILGTNEEQQLFIDHVKEILLIDQPIKMIISIREEYLGYLYEFERQVPELLRKKLRVEPMNLEKVKTVVKEIGQLPQTNVRLQGGREEEIATGIFEKIRGEEKTLSIQLPYLQVFLDKLYLTITGDEQRKAEAIFTLEALEKLGDIGDVLRNFLDEQVLSIARQMQQQPKDLWQILSPFVTLEGTKEPLSVKQLTDRLSKVNKGVIANILRAFWKGRILRYDENEGVYEIMHDSLAGQIHAKRSDEEIALLEVQRLVKSQTALNASAREYFSERQLNFIAPYRQRLILNEAEKNYLQSSEKAVAADKLRIHHRRIAIIVAVIIALLAMSGLTIWALNQQKQTQAALEVATEAQTVAQLEKEKAEKALTDFRNEQAEKARIEYDALENRVNTILQAGGCPSDLYQQMRSIIQLHPDSTMLNNRLTQTINQNPACQ